MAIKHFPVVRFTSRGREYEVDERLISAGAFWPDIVLRELRLAVRLPGRVTTSRLLHTATGAVAHVTRELEAWQQEQQAAGHQTLADVPAAGVRRPECCWPVRCIRVFCTQRQRSGA
ncbi:Phage head completion protein (GPL) [Escherichia coli]|nr:Phage head completion protein (GPL) [Escherichia coli]